MYFAEDAWALSGKRHNIVPQKLKLSSLHSKIARLCVTDQTADSSAALLICKIQAPNRHCTTTSCTALQSRLQVKPVF